MRARPTPAEFEQDIQDYARVMSRAGTARYPGLADIATLAASGRVLANA